jgi:hypothetical protein
VNRGYDDGDGRRESRKRWEAGEAVGKKLDTCGQQHIPT